MSRTTPASERRKAASVLAAFVALGLAAACGGGRSGGGEESSAAVGPGGGGTTDTGPLTDPQILQILQSEHTEARHLGQLAELHASSPSTVAFASRMVTESKAAYLRAQTIVTNTGMQPEASTISQGVDTQDGLMQFVLNGKTGLDWDKSYAQSQVLQHQQLLAMINDQMLPAVTDAALKTELETLAPTAQEHMTSAQELLTELEASPATTTPPPAPAVAGPDAGTADAPDPALP